MPEPGAGGGRPAVTPGAELRRMAGLTQREFDSWDPDLLRQLMDVAGADEVVWRLRRAHRLRRHLDLDYDALEIILRLVEELERRPPAETSTTRIRVRVLTESPET